MACVIDECHYGRVTTQGDFVRANAVYVAAAASEGYITTWQVDVGYRNVWHPTVAGLLFLEERWADVA